MTFFRVMKFIFHYVIRHDRTVARKIPTTTPRRTRQPNGCHSAPTNDSAGRFISAAGGLLVLPKEDMEASNIHAVARNLRHATRCGSPLTPAGIETLDLDLAFEIAALGRDLALADGERVAGYKVGLTAAAVRASYNYETPVHGYVLESTLVPSGGFIETRQLSNPMAEAEIAFMIRSPLDDPATTLQDVIKATESVAPALEIIDSRWSGGAASLPLLIADNTNAAAAVVGIPVRLPADIANATSLLTVGDTQHPGSTDSVMGNPLESVAWLARQLASQGSGLKAGDVVLSGSMNVPVPLGDAPAASAQITGLGSVHASFR